MPKLPSMEPVLDKERDRWRLNVPAELTGTGKRERHWFKTRKAGRDYAAKFADDDDALSLPTTFARDAEAARRLLEPTGATVLDAARAYLASWEARHRSETWAEAAAAYLDSRSNLRGTTLASYRYTLERVFLPLADRVLADIATGDLTAILDAKGATASEMHRRNLRAFWRWAAKPPRSWCHDEVVAALEARRTSDDEDIEFLRHEEVEALLRAAEAQSHAAAAAYAIAVFGGVRQAELAKLRWCDVGEDHITIGKRIAKKHSRRLVPIGPTLRSWLDAHRDDALDGCLVVGSNWRDVSNAVRRRAGWDVSARLLKDPPEPTRGAWPANAPRHTCATVLVATGTPLEALTFSFGHSEGHDLLRKHYVGQLPKKEALAILAIGPKGETVETIRAIA